MDHLLLSPHPDDAVLSLGACISAWRRAGQSVHVITVFDGPPMGEPTPAALEDRTRYTGDPVLIRQAEDRRAVNFLGAELVTLGMPELVYRRRVDGTPRCEGLHDIFGPLQSSDELFVEQVRTRLAPVLVPGATVHAPVGTGGHNDHRLVRAAAEQLTGIELRYYDDQPYAVRQRTDDPLVTWPAIDDADIEAWLDAIACYPSQTGILFETADWRLKFRDWAQRKVRGVQGDAL